MEERHWRFLGTLPYTLFLVFLFVSLLVPPSLGTPLRTGVVVGVGGLLAVGLAYAGGYERLGREGPGRSDVVELLVVVPVAALAGFGVVRVFPAAPTPWVPLGAVLVGLFVGQFLFERVVAPRVGVATE